MHHTSANPFYPGTSICFRILDRTPVVVEIFDRTGNPVKKIVDDSLPIGRHCIEWDATDDFGTMVPAGVYLYRVSSDDCVQTHRIIVMGSH